MARKLNSMRALEQAQIPYEALTFPESIHSAVGVAQHLGIPASVVYKTLVVERPAGRRPLLVLVAADRTLNLKRLAACLGEKRLHMARHADAERLTGLQVGGISALALLGKGFPTYLDRPVLELESVVVSAGRPGVDLRLGVGDFIRITGAQVVDASQGLAENPAGGHWTGGRPGLAEALS